MRRCLLLGAYLSNNLKGASCTLGNIGLISNTLGGTGPFTQVTTALEAFRIGKGTHLYLKLAADSLSHMGSGSCAVAVVEDSEAVRM